MVKGTQSHQDPEGPVKLVRQNKNLYYCTIYWKTKERPLLNQPAELLKIKLYIKKRGEFSTLNAWAEKQSVRYCK